uniref:Cytochrome c biogenesis protein CcsA n=1 Tax=Neochloris aquatica TaxID=3099 RepID=A0A140H9L6_9CHLO|nr:heme attachment to plastid cytochrome c [Neochloris aquatica]AMO00865.1 heme attachment to plastid cytochrome c [Neochloris aquatica]
MDFFYLEKTLSNFSFLILLASMVFYWIQLSFNLKNRYVGTVMVGLGNLSILLLLVLRWKESGHFPLSNLYESFLFLSWNLTLLHLILEKLTTQSFQKFFGAITAPTALLICLFANFSLPEEMQKSSALVPALQSNWLMMHVTVMILSYAALISGSLLSIAFLVLTYNTGFSYNDQTLQFNNNNNNNNFNLKNPKLSLENKFNLALLLDNLSYRILGIGFPLLTIGILSGAVWANEAWGSYWSWDPKETWALLTWLVFAIYLHTRFTKGWQGRKPAIIASLGFFTVWICFLGVNLLGEGLHSYGFFA